MISAKIGDRVEWLGRGERKGMLGTIVFVIARPCWISIEWDSSKKKCSYPPCYFENDDVGPALIKILKEPPDEWAEDFVVGL